MYNNMKWLDKVVDAETGELIQEGTDQSAANFNNMENGITDVHIANAITQIAKGQICKITTVQVDETGGRTVIETKKCKYGERYQESVMFFNHYITVVMGGVDITDSACTVINLTRTDVDIEKVTGDVVIIATAYPI